ncbi:immunoglobulin domain-containing protein [Candidatus Neomarinimicrobiota bacterium]
MAEAGDQSINLTWSANSESDLHKYNIYRDTFSPATTLVDSVVGSPPDTMYTDTGLTNDQTYYYRIKAADADGNASDYSAEASAIPIGPPAAPVLASPADGAVQQDIRPVLTWNASPEAASYHLEVATSAAFSTLVFDTDSIAGTSRQVGPLASSWTYYWRVRGENVAGLGDYSAVWSFTTNPPFDAPAVTIVDSFDVPGSSTTGLAWDGGSLWMIDNLENVYQLDTTGAVLQSFASSYTASGLTWDGDHLWLHNNGIRLVALTTQGDYVRELDVGYHPYSGMAWDGRYFWVGDYNNGYIHKHNTDGGELLYFDSNFFGHPTGMDYNGDYLLIGDSFELYNRIYKYSTTGQELANFNLNDVGLTGAPADQKKLAWDGRYLWYTSDARFKIYKLSIPYYHAAPAVPTLLSPGNGAEVDSLNPRLSWNPSQDAASYQLQVADNPSFDPTIYDNAGLTAPAVQMAPMNEDVTYYWRVRAQNSAGTSAYTSTWNFYVPDLTAPASPVDLIATPGDGEITLTWSANSEPDLAQYRIYRDMASPASTLIDSVMGAPPGISYIDTNVSYPQVTYYRLTAMDGAGNESDFSNEISATPLSPLHADSTGLVALYNSTDGANWTNHSGWLSPDTALTDWYGVTVSGGRVTELNLYQNNLSGILPLEIGNLTKLTHLYLANEPSTGQMTGAIPPEIGNLVTLESLSLRGHQLSGTIPVEIGNLTSLNSLDLAYNLLSGPLPAELWTLTPLETLDLGGNGFSGSIPPEIGNLTNLSVLWLSLNQLSGSIPSEIFTLTQMEDLRLRNNSLSGSIPATISNMPDLSILDLRWNQFTGPIPDEITSLTGLSYIFLTGNQFTSLPHLESLTTLNTLCIEENQFTFKDIEQNVGIASSEYTYTPQDSVGAEQDTTVYVDSDLTLELSVGGTVALNTYTWERDGSTDSIITGDSTYTITDLDFADAGSYTCSATNDSLPGLTLYSRPINVTVEYTALQQDSLALIALYNSTGGANWTDHSGWLSPDTALAGWYGVTVSDGRVTRINLGDNNLTGTIPSEIGNLTSLTDIMCFSNQLSGAIPPAIGNLINLAGINLGGNQLNGPIPGEIAGLANLSSLQLSGNQLSGMITAEIWDLANLSYLALGDNQLSGSIPAEIGNLINLSVLYLSANQLSGSLPTELFGLTKLVGLSLSNNSLSGLIPAEIGNLVQLQDLRLDGNQLSGPIPVEIQNLTLLEILFLEDNEFTALPNLSSLPLLHAIRVAGNQLTFEDMEPNLGILTEIYMYTPQDSVGMEIDTTMYVDSNLILELSVGGTPALNTYAWEKNGNPLGSPIPGDSTYTITNIDFADEGSYTCSAINDSIPGLTLHGRPIYVTVIDSVPPEPPVGLAAAPGYEEVTLSWSPNSELDLSHYLVYQGLTSGFDTTGAMVARVDQPETETIITDLVNGTTYYFRLAAVDTWGNVSRLLVEASAVPVAYPVLVAATDAERPLGWHEPEVTFTFDLPLDPATVNGSAVNVVATHTAGPGVNVVYQAAEQRVAIRFQQCLTSMDTVTITLVADNLLGASGLPIDGDADGVADGSPEDDIVRTYAIATYADFDTSGTVDFDDLAIFTAGWYGEDLACELGPATGIVPHLIMTPDDDFNLRDLMTFIRMWDWYTPQAAPLAKAFAQSNRLELNVSTNGQQLLVGLDPSVEPAAVHLQLTYVPDKVQAAPDSSGSSYSLQIQRLWPGEGILEIDAALPGELAGELVIPVSLEIQGREAVSVAVYMEAVDRNGQLLGTAEQTVEVKPVPLEFALHQNYPNPFNPTTTVDYDLPVAGDVALTVYDLLGREVIRLVDGYAEAGYYQAVWRGRSAKGEGLPSGIYLVRLAVPGHSQTIKTLLLK